MNIQIFNNADSDSIVSIDMARVIAIYEAEVCAVLHGAGGYTEDSDVIKKIGDCSYNDTEKATGFAIDVGLNTEENTWHVQCRFTTNELWDALGFSNGEKYTEKQKMDSLFENFDDDYALALMVKYWKNIADTPLTTKLLGESRFRVPQQRSDSIPTKEEQDDPNVCKKLLCSLVKHDGTLIWDEIVYPGYAEDIESDEFLAMLDALDFARCDDKDHNDLIVTDDIVCLAERMTEEWEGKYRGESACEYVAHVLDAMVGGQLKADEIIIDGRMFNAAEGQRIYVSRYTKDIVYDGRTQEYLKKIGKELKK